MVRVEVNEASPLKVLNVFFRCSISKAGMQAFFKVVFPIFFEENFHLGKRDEEFAVKKFIPKARVETFGKSILPRGSRSDKKRIDVLFFKELLEGLSDKLRAIVRANRLRCSALSEKRSKDGQDILRLNGTCGNKSKRFSSVFIDESKYFQASTVDGLVAHEVVGPNIVGV